MKGSVHDEIWLKKITELKPDLILSLRYGEILKKPLLNIPTKGVINFHPSLLPKYGGKRFYGEKVHNAVIKSNDKRRILLIEKVKKILSNKIKNKKIAFLGVTFKPNTDDMRQSSSLSMIPFLLKKGSKITYYDPSGEKKEFSKLKNILFCNNVREACKNVDLVIIHTEWDEFKALDFKKLYRKKKFKIYDMRNLYSVVSMKKKGFDYYSIGR